MPFVGGSLLGHLFGTASAIPIWVASLVVNHIQVPPTLMLLSAGLTQRTPLSVAKQPLLKDHIAHALREPVVWAPILALVFRHHFPAKNRTAVLTCINAARLPRP